MCSRLHSNVPEAALFRVRGRGCTPMCPRLRKAHVPCVAYGMCCPRHVLSMADSAQSVVDLAADVAVTAVDTAFDTAFDTVEATLQAIRSQPASDACV